MLPAVAARLLADCADASPDSMDADLSGLLLVVRGRNAGRRLLALLAAESQRLRRALIPPRIITPGGVDSVLFEREEATAGRLVQRLAWDAVVKQAPVELLDQIWESPDQQDRSLVLSRFLDQTWQELSTTGADFSQAYRELEKIAPEVADREEERWQGLQSILETYFDCLHSWGLGDPAEIQFRRSRDAAIQAGLRVVLVGVVELAPVLVRLLARLPEEPLVFIHAPESESGGFDEWGRLLASHWEKRPCRFVQGEVHVVADAAQQAQRCAELVLAWQQGGLAASSITLAVPEPEALPILDQTLRDRGIAARRAEGQSAAHTAAVRLLALVSECLGPTPLYSAVADLVRHPDLEKSLGHSAKRLDDYFNEHLPWRLDLASGEEAEQPIAELLARIRELTRIQSETFADDVTRLLLEIYGERRLNRHGPEDRALLHALEAIRDALDEIQSLPRKALRAFEPADLLRIVAEAAGSVGVPSPEEPDAVELAGWLEAAADDAPALIVTSVFEGSLPEGGAAEPLLHDALRKQLGLPCRASRHARDQYTLWTVTQSRPERFALIAPRRNASGIPVRPSRLLIAGHADQELATRLLALTAPSPSALPTLPEGAGFSPPEPDPERMRAFRIFPVTSFRTYLASPRLFYFKYILRLRDQTDDAEEMDAALFGTTIHAVLQAFGEKHLGNSTASASEEIERELEALLRAYLDRQFGPKALPPVHTQYHALQERLRLFAQHQAVAFAEGWKIAYVEGGGALQVPFPLPDGPEGVELKGKIDRIDWHPDGRWRVIDYKTSAQAVKPITAHFAKQKGIWKDLQLPLYIRLLPALDALQGSNIDPAQTDLVYFNLPAKSDDAGITEPFPAERVEEAWQEAEAIMQAVCSGDGCQETGKITDNEDTAFAALCGVNGLFVPSEEDV